MKNTLERITRVRGPGLKYKIHSLEKAYHKKRSTSRAKNLVDCSHTATQPNHIRGVELWLPEVRPRRHSQLDSTHSPAALRLLYWLPDVASQRLVVKAT